MKLSYNPTLRKTARTLRQAGNLSEALLWRELKAKKLGVQFLRQRPIDKYIVDFFCSQLNLVIEIDGISHDTKIEKDAKRQAVLESKGVRFLRFLDSDIRYNLPYVLIAIQECIKSSAPIRIGAPPLRKEE